MQLLGPDQNTIFIAIDVSARLIMHTSKMNGFVAGSNSQLTTLGWIAAEGHNPPIQFANGTDITDHAVNDHATPPVIHAHCSDHVSH